MSSKGTVMEKTKSFLLKNTMIIALVLVYLFFTFKSEGRMFLPQNINNLIMQNSYVVILAVGMLLCILTGGNIDLSVGATVCLVGAIAGVLMVNLGWNIYLVMVICLLTGTAIGVWQGFWIAYVRVPPFIVTLAGMLLFRGLAQAILGGTTISGFSEEYLAIFNNYVNIPALDSGVMKYSAIIFGVICCLVFIIASVMTNLTRNARVIRRKNPCPSTPKSWSFARS